MGRSRKGVEGRAFSIDTLGKKSWESKKRGVGVLIDEKNNQSQKENLFAIRIVVNVEIDLGREELGEELKDKGKNLHHK